MGFPLQEVKRPQATGVSKDVKGASQVRVSRSAGECLLCDGPGLIEGRGNPKDFHRTQEGQIV